MAILEKEVSIVVGGNNLKHYESLGYNIPRYIDSQNRKRIKRGTKILVKIEDLTRQSNAKVTKVCDDCGKHVLNQEYGVVLNRREESSDDRDRCYKCGKINGTLKKKNNVDFKRSLEFYAVENGKNYLLNEFSKNNTKKPKEISYGTEDEYLWNCPKCESEYSMKVVNRTYQKCNCPYCSGARVNHTNCLWTTHPEIAKILTDPQRGYEVTAGSNKSESFTCPNCNYVDTKCINDVVNQRFSCPKCSDGLSYPEKFMFNILTQLEIKVERQKVFQWSKNIESKNKRLNGTKK